MDASTPQVEEQRRSPGLASSASPDPIYSEIGVTTAHEVGRRTPKTAGVLGIDFGTCNCCMAIMEGGEPIVIPNAEGDRITPSVVALAEGERWLVGQAAKRQAVSNPGNTVFSVKRLMGRKHHEVCHAAKWLPYEVAPVQNGDEHVRIGGRLYSPPELAAMILRKLKMDAEAYLNSPVTQAIITVPSCFNATQRAATRDAARIAGLEVLRIINESTAACMAYGVHTKRDEIAAVVHFGGGTFDVSILNIGDGVFEVVCTTGDNHLGGDDMDWSVVEWLAGEFKRTQYIDLTTDRTALQRLREAAETAKCDLSATQQTEILLPFIGADQSGPKHLKATLTRQQLEIIAGPILERLRAPVATALKDAEWHLTRYGGIGHVVLAGAMTRMPKVQDEIKNLFQREPCKGVHPEEVVAIGAAIQGSILKGEVKDVLLLDVTPLSLGIETLGGVYSPLIVRNTTIPTKKSAIFSTAADNQSSVEIHALQGERKMAADNKTIGRFTLDQIPPAPCGIPQIEVSFDIDSNDLLHVSAKDLGTGREQRVTITASSGLTEKEIRIAMHTSERFSKDYAVRSQPIKAKDTVSSNGSEAEPEGSGDSQ